MGNIFRFSEFLKIYEKEEGDDPNQPSTSEPTADPEIVRPEMLDIQPAKRFNLPHTEEGLPTIKDGVKYDLPDDQTLKTKLMKLVGEKEFNNFSKSCEDIGLPIQIALRQLWTESGFNPKARSSAGARGLAQFMPISWPSYGKGSPYNPINSLKAYVKLMDELINKKFPKRLDLALAGYNWGPNRGVLKNALANEMDFTDIQNQLRGETRKYVHKILA